MWYLAQFYSQIFFLRILKNLYNYKVGGYLLMRALLNLGFDNISIPIPTLQRTLCYFLYQLMVVRVNRQVSLNITLKMLILRASSFLKPSYYY